MFQEDITVNHDVTGSSPVRGAIKEKESQSGSFLLPKGRLPVTTGSATRPSEPHSSYSLLDTLANYISLLCRTPFVKTVDFNLIHFCISSINANN